MILVDTSVWIDHFRRNNFDLVHLLYTGQILSHPFVIGELALGSLHAGHAIVSSLKNLPQAKLAHEDEVLIAINRWKLSGSGIGYADAHLLVSAGLTAGAKLWTGDRRLRALAVRLHLDSGLK